MKRSKYQNTEKMWSFINMVDVLWHKAGVARHIKGIYLKPN